MASQFEFEYPWLLALLALLPVYAFWLGRSGRRPALRFSSAEVARTVGATARSAVGQLAGRIRFLTVALGIVALAGPRFAEHRTETEASGVDIMLVLDISWSMMALDMGQPGERISRMAIAREVLGDFIRRRPSDRIGLVVFSAVPYLASPLTLNQPWLLRNLDRLHVGMIRELGTAIGDATAAAVRRLSAQEESKSRLVILLTDGDNNRGEIDPLPAAELATALGARLYTVGIGREEPCMLPAFDPATGKLKLDSNGGVIPTIALQPANYEVLEKMSAISGGRFYRATNRRELSSIYREIDRLEKSEFRLRRQTIYTPLFQWPLTAALVLLGLEVLLASTRFRRVP